MGSFKMERKEEVRDAIGENAFDIMLEEVLQYMLDMWWETELYMKEVDGLSCLLEILDDKYFGLQALAEKIRTSESKRCPLTSQRQQELPTNKGKKDPKDGQNIITTGNNFLSRNSNSINSSRN